MKSRSKLFTKKSLKMITKTDLSRTLPVWQMGTTDNYRDKKLLLVRVAPKYSLFKN
jgi:hypothetical protein